MSRLKFTRCELTPLLIVRQALLDARGRKGWASATFGRDALEWSLDEFRDNLLEPALSRLGVSPEELAGEHGEMAAVETAILDGTAGVCRLSGDDRRIVMELWVR